MSASHSTKRNETWRPVIGFPLYEVSDQGRVRSWCGGRWARRASPRLLKPGLGVDGYYLTVSLRRATKYVHALVLEAFVGPRPPGMEMLHGPGGTQDNRLSNLSYGTRSKNRGEDRARDGTDNRGEKHPLHKLTEQDVRTIRARIAKGELQADVAKDFNVKPSVVSRIMSGKRWGWLT